MRYKLVIQALRESSDNNVQAFVKDVEKIKRLTAEERQYYLAGFQSARIRKTILSIISWQQE